MSTLLVALLLRPFSSLCLFLAVLCTMWHLGCLPDQGLNLCALLWTLGVLTAGPHSHYFTAFITHLGSFITSALSFSNKFFIYYPYTSQIHFLFLPKLSWVCIQTSYSIHQILSPRYTAKIHCSDILQPISALILQAPCVPRQLCTLDISTALLMCPLSPSPHVCLLKTHLSVRF